ncbi:MAG TPA: DUF2905 domain-containing protein [Gammaproteobacteria bacterium]|nr:DUF2905 domain-containing protein [Gammaproteobacteria bacterium]
MQDYTGIRYGLYEPLAGGGVIPVALGKILLLLGGLTALVGAILLWAPGLLGWFGHLPGDIRIERDNGGFYFPITSMLIVSIVLSVIVNLFFRR